MLATTGQYRVIARSVLKDFVPEWTDQVKNDSKMRYVSGFSRGYKQADIDQLNNKLRELGYSNVVKLVSTRAAHSRYVRTKCSFVK